MVTVIGGRKGWPIASKSQSRNLKSLSIHVANVPCLLGVPTVVGPGLSVSTERDAWSNSHIV